VAGRRAARAAQGITHAGIRALVGIEYLTGLRELNLRTNPITNKGARALAESPYLGNLGVLDLMKTKIGPVGAALLTERFQERVRL
jgi:Ran GTPase-activating protein (RanGAP) involved in mRNA processing and transport